MIEMKTGVFLIKQKAIQHDQFSIAFYENLQITCTNM